MLVSDKPNAFCNFLINLNLITFQTLFRKSKEFAYLKVPKVEDGVELALPILGLFERVGIDLVLGLPADNPEQFNGILVITEYFSKYPYAVPIRSKEAVEIATHLFQYISLFGPPKVLLSDQGKEFVNAVVDKLLQQVGTEHTE